MEKNLIQIIKFIILYSGVSFLVSVYETETILTVFESGDRINAGVASYISTVVSTVITAIILGTTGYVGAEVTSSFTKQISSKDFKDAYVIVIISLILVELIAFVSAYLTLENELQNIAVDTSFAESLTKTTWYETKDLLSKISTWGSSIIIIISLLSKSKMRKGGFIEILLISTLVMTCLVLSSIKWF